MMFTPSSTSALPPLRGKVAAKRPDEGAVQEKTPRRPLTLRGLRPRHPLPQGEREVLQPARSARHWFSPARGEGQEH
jgi:hypothetical protein